MRNRNPTLIYIIAIILFVIAAYTFISGLIIAIGVISGNDSYQEEKTIIRSTITDSSGQEYERYTESIIITGGIFDAITLLIVTIVFIILGIGLLQRRNWARIIVIIISIFAVLDSLSGTVSGYYHRIPELVIFVSIATYLIASRNVKSAFRKRN